MRDPSLAQEFNTTESNLQITIRQSLEATDHQFSNILPLWDNGFENATGPGGLFDVQYFNSNEDDWVAGLLDTGKYPHLNGDTTSLEGSQLEEAISYGGVYFEAGSSFTPHNHVPLTRPRNSTAPHVNREDQIANRTRETNTWKPYREILPSCRTEGQSAEGESQPQTHRPGAAWVYISDISGSSHWCGGVPLDKSTRRKPGRLTGSKLDIQTKEHAAEMRRIGACFRCKAMKVTCSTGEICATCEASSSIRHFRCRQRLQDYTSLFFPDVVNCGFQDSVVENLIRDNVPTGFYDNEVEVEISSGPTYWPISLRVHEFQPANEEFLALSHIKTDDDGNLSSEFTRRYAPPFALPPIGTEVLREKCLEHVETIARSPRSEGEVYYRDTSRVSWDILSAIYQYQKSTDDKLVGQAMVLYAMHYFMTQILVFTEDSADLAIKSLHQPTKLPYTCALTSKLISLQIKRVMFKLVRETTGDTLRKLENTMLDGRANDGKAWAISFCVISILCMCAEMVQVATDLKIVHMMREEEGYEELSRDDRMNRDREGALLDCRAKFHLVFKTHKPNGNQKNERGFNPLRYALDIYNYKGLSKDTENLINDVRQVLAEREDEIGQRVIEPSIQYDHDDLSDLLARHLTFREETSGKHVSRFLRSFFENE